MSNSSAAQTFEPQAEPPLSDRGGPIDFEALLRPVPAATFFDRYWEQEVLHVEGRGRGWFADLDAALSIAATIQLHCPNWGDVSLARAGTDASACPYIRDPPSLRGIERAFADNYTVVINDLQKKNLAVAALCRTVEAALFCRANVNLYLTNAGSQGLNVHYDDDDVFVIQLAGTKVWKTYADKALWPMPGSPYEVIDVTGSACRTHVVKAGDLLYVPRGVLHEAASVDEVSLHLTVATRTLRWQALLQKWMDAAVAAQPALRRSIPPACLRNLSGAGAAFPADVLGDLIGDHGLWQLALGRVQDELLDGPARLAQRPFGVRADPAEIGPATLVRVSPDQICGIEDADGCCVLKAVGSSFRFPADRRDLVLGLSGPDAFSAQSLPDSVTLAERLQIVRRLVEDGFLIRT